MVVCAFGLVAEQFPVRIVPGVGVSERLREGELAALVGERVVSSARDTVSIPEYFVCDPPSGPVEVTDLATPFASRSKV